jgi:hypothetical protein
VSKIIHPGEIELRSRRDLSDEEIYELWDWIKVLPNTSWTPTTRGEAIIHLLSSRCALLTLPGDLVSQATYFKLKWG